jgi:hypothetical protein
MPLYSAELFTEFGWFTEKKDSYTFEDYKRNGKFCKSGLAYNNKKDTAKCTTVDEVYQGKGGGPLPVPYMCNPKDPHLKCKLAFTT